MIVLKAICEKPGAWMLAQTPSNKNLMIGGNYSGFVLFQKSNNQWNYVQDIGGFSESVRVFKWENDSVLWMSHGLKGIYKLQFSPNYDSIVQFDLFGEKQGLPSNFSLEINNWNNEIVITSSNGIYSFRTETQTFYLDQEKTDLFSGELPLKLIEDRDRNIWFFTDENLGVLRIQEDGSYSAISSPFTTISNNYVNGFQRLNAMDEDNVIFGSDNGFIHYDPSISKKYNYPFQTYISQIGFLKSDSLLQNTNIIKLHKGSSLFQNNENDFVFNFSASDYENADNMEFSAFLEGYEDDWDMWSIKRTREYTYPSNRYYDARNYAFTYVYPDYDKIVTEQKTYLKDYLTDFQNALNGSSFKDPENGYSKYIDVNSFVDFQIINELSNNVDGYRFSTYFHKKKDSNGGKLFAGPLWDFNLAYGNVDYSPINLATDEWLYTNYGADDWQPMHWWARLMEDPAYQDALYKRWTELRAGPFKKESIIANLEEMVSNMGDAIERNFDKWPIIG